MKKNLAIVTTILFVWLILFLTPFIGGGQTTLDDDGFWRDCPISSESQRIRGCYIATFVFPKLTPEESAFKEKISSFASPPSKVTKADIVHVMGREPDQSIELIPGAGRYQWNNYGPGDDPNRGVVIRLFSDQFKELQWLQPNRFNLSYGFHTKND